LCASAALFQRAAAASSASRGFWFFLCCAALGWLYTTFHLFWFGAMLLGALVFSERGRRRRVIFGALVPGLLLFSLYLKNLLVFGVFGATSWGGANLTLATTHRMPKPLREQWIRAGKLSPYAGISVFAPPAEYLKLLPPDLKFPWPGSNELWRPSLKNAGNYNHGLFLIVNRERRKDSVAFIEARPLDYVETVLGHNLPSLFSSTTHWHPQDARPISPHHQHRQVLGGYERLYDLLVHRFPIPGIGLYVFLPVFCAWAARAAWRGLRSGEPARRSRPLLLGFCLFQVAFVVSASCLFTAQESSRYRYAVEPCIWAVVAAALHAATPWLKKRLSRTREPAGIAPSAAADAAR
jgi:hypothetical protein